MATNPTPSSTENTKTPVLADMLNITVFVINGHSLVSGLLWEKLDKPRSYMAEARAKGKAYGMDIVAIRESNAATQAGFAPKNRGAFKGMYSFAHVMADVLGDNCLAVFELPDDNYALFAILDGSIVPGSDLVGDRDTIESKQNAFRNLVEGTPHKWSRLIAPEGFQLADETLTLESIITARVLKRSQQLRQLTLGLSPNELRKIGLISAIVVVVLGGALYALHRYHLAQQLKEQEAAQAAAIANAKAIAAAEAARSNVHLPHPWNGAPEVDTVLAECIPRLDAFPVSLGGWVLNNAKCQSSGTVGAIYQRQGTQTVADFQAAVEAFYHAPAAIFAGGDTGGVGGSFHLAAGGDDVLPLAQDAENDIASQFQQLDIKAPLTLVPVTPPPTNEKNPPPAPDWKTYSFAINTGHLNPMAAFANLPRAGMRISKVSVTFDAKKSTLSWTTTGDQYAR